MMYVILLKQNVSDQSYLFYTENTEHNCSRRYCEVGTSLVDLCKDNEQLQLPSHSVS